MTNEKTPQPELRYSVRLWTESKTVDKLKDHAKKVPGNVFRDFVYTKTTGKLPWSTFPCHWILPERRPTYPAEAERDYKYFS